VEEARVRGWVRVGAAVLVLAAVVGCVDPADPAAAGGGATGGTSPADVVRAAPTGDVMAALAVLPVRGRAPRTGYERDEFGRRWADVDRNGCDQRNDVLARDLLDVVVRPGTHGCVVLSGRLRDPYTGAAVPFTRGEGTSDDVQIDHVVALSDAWQKGAQRLAPRTRELFANDPLNLMATEGAVNQSKGDADAATWLPPARPFRCAYVARQVAVKGKYGLWVTAAERDAIARVLAGCPGEQLPTDSRVASSG
jgi:hypothetical protein